MGNNKNYVKLFRPTKEQIQKDTEDMDKRGRKMEFYTKSQPLNKYIFNVKALLDLLEIPDVPITSPTYYKNEQKKKDLTNLLTTLGESLKLEGTDFNQNLQIAESNLNDLNLEYSDVKDVKLGGSKSRRRHRRKPVRKTRRGRGRGRKCKPKTHRRRRHSRVRKHKKNTSRRK